MLKVEFNTANVQIKRLKSSNDASILRWARAVITSRHQLSQVIESQKQIKELQKELDLSGGESYDAKAFKNLERAEHRQGGTNC